MFKKRIRAARPVRQGRFIGHLDRIEGGIARGWAYDREHPNQSTHVLVLVDDAVIAVVEASEPRPDVLGNEVKLERTGFRFQLPKAVLDAPSIIDVVAVPPATARAVMGRLETAYLTKEPVTLGSLRGDTLENHSWSLAKTSSEVRQDLSRHSGSKDPSRLYTRKQSSIVLIEIQDLISFLRVHNRVTGIQRVVSGLITGLISQSDSIDVSFEFCQISDHAGSVEVVDKSGILDLIDLILHGKVGQASLSARITVLEQRNLVLTPNRNDIFIISGAYWIVPDYGPRLIRLREAGVVIGAYIYDIIPITHPNWVTNSTARAVFERAIDVLSLADFFLTISEFVKDDLTKLLTLEYGAGKLVQAVPLPHELPFSLGDLHPLSAGTATPFVLCVCTLEGRKNHMLLYRVWMALIRRHGFDKVPKLVLVGKWGWRIDAFREACEQSNYLNGKIVVRSGVDDETLATLYRDCLFTVFPSFVEGWGLPVGEGLSAGKLCVSSNSSSLPEVGGDYVDYFDPHDYFDAVNKIEKPMFDDAYREERTVNIQKNFKRRSWDEFSRHFVQSTVTLARLVSSSGVDTDPRLFAPDRAYYLAGILTSDTMPWSASQAKFICYANWHPLENWGAWSSASEAKLKFVVPFEQNTRIVVWLELRLPDTQISTRLEVLDEASCARTDLLSASAVSEKPTWTRAEALVAAEGVVMLTICRDLFVGGPDARGLYVGVSAIAYHRSDDGEGRAAVMSDIIAHRGTGN